MAGFATLSEVCEDWSLSELLDAHEILDLREAEEARVAAQMRRESERR